MNIVGRVRDLVKRPLEKRHLLVANIGVSFGLSGLGDILQQRLERRQPVSSLSLSSSKASSYNWRRTLNMSTSFGCTAGFLCHYWYLYLDRLLPGRGIRTVVTKIAWDQVLFSPICISACIFVAGILEKKSLDQLFEETIQLGGRLWLSEWFIWPPAQFFNFYFLPTRYRVLYDNLVSLGYDWYTSHLKHSLNYNTGSSKVPPIPEAPDDSSTDISSPKHENFIHLNHLEPPPLGTSSHYWAPVDL